MAPVPLEETTVPRSSPLPVTRRTQTDVASSRGTVATRSASRSSLRVRGRAVDDGGDLGGAVAAGAHELQGAVDAC